MITFDNSNNTVVLDLTSIQMLVSYLASLYYKLKELLDEYANKQRRSQMYAQFAFCLSQLRIKGMKLLVFDVDYVFMSKDEKNVVFGFKNPQKIDIDNNFTLTFSKEIVGQLPQMNHVLYKA